MERGRPREKVRDERMARAVRAGAELFLEQKIETVKMTDIADRAGFGVASLYRYFITKEAIVIAAAELIWGDIKARYLPGLESPEFKQMSGIEQIRGILDVYSQLLRDDKPFLRFLSDFDAFCVHSGIPKEQLADYEKSLGDFCRPYHAALEKGARDGTVAVNTEPRLLYLTVNHTMLSLLKKIIEGEILSQDADIARELEVMKQIFLRYFQS